MTMQAQARPPGHTDQQGEHWLGDTVNVAAREQVFALVQALSRARWQQVFIDCASTAVFAALLSSIAAVLAIRSGWLALSPWIAVFGLTLFALAIAAGFAFIRRPDHLEVAIDADLQLNLKQRLSTAWEFMCKAQQSQDGRDCELDDTVGRLAAQAVKARLPARSRAGQVFTARANVFAIMTPVALIALLLVSIVDLDFAMRAPRADTDEMVISEGVRLRAYGKRMQSRARQRDLPRSDEQSLRVQELGARMQSGALSRDEALSRLRDLDDDLDSAQRDALNQGEHTDIGPVSTQPVNAGPRTRGVSAQQLLQQMLDGNISPSAGARQMLDSDPSGMSRNGVSSAQIREALERFADGDRSALEDMLDKLSSASQAARDADELNKAREQVSRARESLGDKSARPREAPGTARRAPKNAQTGTPSDAERGAAMTLDDDAGEDGSSMPGARGENSRRTREQRPSNSLAENNDNGPQLRARGQIRDGGVFVSEARVLPRTGAASIDNTQVDAQYRPQLEQIMSSEQYPLHYKEYIRRYFLTLSEGGRAPQADPLPKPLSTQQPAPATP